MELCDRQKVEITHSSGLKFYIYLTSYELNRARTDHLFLEELSDKYYSFHKKGLIGTGTQEQVDVCETENEYNNEYTADHLEEENINIERSYDFYSKHHNSTDVSDRKGIIPTIRLNPVATGASTNNVLSAENNRHQRYLWPRPAVIMLLAELYELRDELLQPNKSKNIFTKISKKLNENNYPVLWQSCERKWRGLQDTYKKIIKDENRSGSGSSRWEFYDQVADIVRKDPSYKPKITVALGLENSRNENMCDTNNDRQSKKKKKTETDNWTREAFERVNNSVLNLQESINNMKDIQEQRNHILDRMAVCLEKLTQ